MASELWEVIYQYLDLLIDDSKITVNHYNTGEIKSYSSKDFFLIRFPDPKEDEFREQAALYISRKEVGLIQKMFDIFNPNELANLFSQYFSKRFDCDISQYYVYFLPTDQL